MFFKVNHTNPLEWNDDNNDLHFIVICAERESESGFSTHGCSNNCRKNGKVMTKQFSTIGHFTLHHISSFDLLIETDLKHTKRGSKVINRNALKACVHANSHRPHAIAHLEQLLTTAEQEEDEGRHRVIHPVKDETTK